MRDVIEFTHKLKGKDAKRCIDLEKVVGMNYSEDDKKLYITDITNGGDNRNNQVAYIMEKEEAERVLSAYNNKK